MIRLPYFLLSVLLILCQSCLVYSNRTTFNAHTTFPVTSEADNSLKSGIIIHLSKITTSGLLPFVFTLGEKGDYALSIQLYGDKTNAFDKILVNKIEIMLDNSIVFQTVDPYFLKPEYENIQYYKSAHLIKLRKNISKLDIYLNAELVKRDGSRERLVIRREIDAQKDKGFSFFYV